MDACGLHHCLLEAARDLRCARARYAFEPVDWALLVRQLNADIDAANRFLPDDLQASIGYGFGVLWFGLGLREGCLGPCSFRV